MSKTKKQLTKQQKLDLSGLGVGVFAEIIKMKDEGEINNPKRKDTLLFYLDLCARDILRSDK